MDQDGGHSGEDETELAGRQPTALYPIGRALRSTFDAENHESLGNDLTGLMLELAHIDPDAQPLSRGAMPVPAAPAAVPPPVHASTPVSWWRATVDRLLAR
jgi:hypothetical protein